VGNDVAVAIVRDRLSLDAFLAAAREALPSEDLVLAIGDGARLPSQVQAVLGSITTGAIWSCEESPSAFDAFVVALSVRSGAPVLGLTVVDHACVSAAVVAEAGAVVHREEADGEAYLLLAPRVVASAFGVEVSMPSDDLLFLTEQFLPTSEGMLCQGQAPPRRLSAEDLLAVREADHAFLNFECLLGI
jgi:hypothetical protein